MCLLGACTLSSARTIEDPTRPGQQIEVRKEIGELCQLICDALVTDYGVPTDQRARCEGSCASGFAREPDACYELVSCVADRTLCDAGNFSASCAARAGACLAVWELGNGICRSCWSPNRPVAGVRRRIYRSDTPGEMVVPEDLSRAKVTAYLPVPEGPWPAFSGSGDATGKLQIAEVPGCGYFLEVEDIGQRSSYSYEFHEASDVLDEDVVWLGRPDATRVATTTRTQVRFEVDGLSPWSAPSSLEVFVPNVQGWWARGIVFEVGEAWAEVADGATRIFGSTMEWPRGTGLPEASKGDRAYVLQFSPVATGSPGFEALAVDRVLVTPPITFEDSRTATITGTFTTAGLSEGSLQLGVHFTEFVRFAAGQRPTFRPASAGASVHSVPTDRYDIDYAGPSPDFLWIYPTDPSAPVTDLVLPQPLRFKDPMPATWTRQLDIAYSTTSVYVVAPGTPHTATQPGNGTEQRDFVFQRVAVDLRLQDLPAGSMVEPLVGTVSNLRIAGRPSGEDMSGVGLTPAITWDPPALGTATRYIVSVWELVVGDQKRLAGSFELPRTSLTLPPGVLERGHHYVVVLAARREEAARAGTAELSTGVLTP